LRLARVNGHAAIPFPGRFAALWPARDKEFAMAGLWFEEFAVGQLFDHPLRRTVTETDNLLTSALTHNPAPLHLDAEYMKDTEYGRILVNSCFTLGLMVGISVNDTTQGTAVANLGWDEVRFPGPIFVGDTLRIQTEVLAVRESKSRPGQGIVTFAHRAYNQEGELVAHCKRMSLQRKRPADNG
jgi:acyl dehydratase